jgi:O-antigen/teichoic acid export membrane protein
LATAAAPAPSAESSSCPQPSRTHSFLKGAGAGYLSQAVAMLVGLWMTPFLLHRLGQQDYGLWLAGSQILGYMMLLDLGVIGLLPREAAYAMGRAAGNATDADQTELPELVGRVLRIATWQLPLMAIGAVVLWWLNPVAWPQLRGPLALVLAAFVVLFPTRILHATLAGLQDLGFLNLAQLTSFLVTAAGTIVLVLRGWRLYSLAIAWVAGQLLIALIWSFRLWRRYPQALPRRLPHVSWREARQYLNKSSWMTVNSLATALLSGTDMLIVGKLLGPAAVVPYACTAKLLQVFGNQPQMLLEQALPGLSHMRFSESRDRIRQAVTALSQGMLLFSGAVATAVLLLNRSFVGWWVGKDQYAGVLLTVLLITALLLRHWSLTIAMSVFCFGYERTLGLRTLADALLSVIGSIAFVHYLGFIGVPLGTIVGVCTISIPWNLRTLSRELKVRPIRLMTPILSWLVRVAILLAAAWQISRLSIDSFPAMAGAGVAALLAYALLMWPVISRPPLSFYAAPLLRRLSPIFLRRPENAANVS